MREVGEIHDLSGEMGKIRGDTTFWDVTAKYIGRQTNITWKKALGIPCDFVDFSQVDSWSMERMGTV